MKQVNNRQKLVVRPRESAQKYLLKTKGVRKGAEKRLRFVQKSKGNGKGRN